MTDNIKWNDVLMNNYGTPPIELVAGKGATVEDSRGRVHIDLLAGIAVNALGHGHPAIVEAVTRQLSQLGHVSNLFATGPVMQAAASLKERVGDDSARVFFCNSGGEANEAAFKLARLTGRSRILAAVHGFHGRTMGSLALTGQPDKRKAFEPLPTGVEFYPYGDVDYLHKLVETNPSDVAAIFLEPVQGETGVVPAPAGFLQAVRDLCDEHGILMVCDEVQTGVGRTGTFFAFQHDGVLPDVITMAKGLGGGIPIGATIARGKAAELFQPGAHGTTFGGNPVACAAANAVLGIVDDEFCDGVREKGAYFAEKLSAIGGVDHVRGRGLMLGVVLDKPVAKEAVTQGFDHGLILNAPAEDIIRLTPPLIISEEEIDAAVEKLSALINDLTKEG